MKTYFLEHLISQKCKRQIWKLKFSSYKSNKVKFSSYKSNERS